jgi:hypothetical protein
MQSFEQRQIGPQSRPKLKNFLGFDIGGQFLALVRFFEFGSITRFDWLSDFGLRGRIILGFNNFWRGTFQIPKITFLYPLKPLAICEWSQWSTTLLLLGLALLG